MLNRPHVITPDAEIPAGGAEGVLLCQGSNNGGWSLYVKDGRLHYAHNYVGRATYQVSTPGQLPTLKLDDSRQPAVQARACDMQPGMSSIEERAQQRQRQIAAEIAELGLCPPGTLIQRTTRCGTSTCRCHSDPGQRHGPYPSWIRKAGTKTLTRNPQPRSAGALPAAVRQHQAPPRTDQRT